VERGDTGLGRDAYGPPRRERSRHAYGPDAPYSPDDAYQAPLSEDEETEGERTGKPISGQDDDYGQFLRHPGEMPSDQPHQVRPREPGNPPMRPPDRRSLGPRSLGRGGPA
jgi:hypothetical protein